MWPPHCSAPQTGRRGRQRPWSHGECGLPERRGAEQAATPSHRHCVSRWVYCCLFSPAVHTLCGWRGEKWCVWCIWEESPTYCVFLEFETPEVERCMACQRYPNHSCLRAAVSAAYTHTHTQTQFGGTVHQICHIHILQIYQSNHRGGDSPTIFAFHYSWWSQT